MPLISTLRRPSNTVILLIAAVASVLLICQLWWINGSSIALPAGHFISGSRHATVDDINNATLGVRGSLLLYSLTRLTCWGQFEKIYVIALPARTDRRDGIVLSAALSNMTIDLMDGVRGETISDKAIPAAEGYKRMPDPVIGCWRGHMNTIQEFVSYTLLDMKFVG
jgi:hypothetical protein